MSDMPTQTFIDFLKSQTIEEIAGAMIELQKTVDRLTAEQPAQKRPQNCGTGYCSCIECVVEPAQQEPVAWPIETNNQVEGLAKQCGWDNRRYMTPADYQIWCDRMRQFVQLASPPTQQQEPDYAWPIIADYEREVWGGEKANDAFRAGWNIARTTNSFISQLAGVTSQPAQQDPYASFCANCGKPQEQAAQFLSDYPDEGEWFCSMECKDQHDELGCPHEHHGGYRHPAEARRLIDCESALRSLASWLGVGGYNADHVDAKVFEEKIRHGVEHLHSATPQPAQRKPLTYCQECMRPNPKDGTVCAHGIKEKP